MFTVKDIMTDELYTLKPTDTVHQAQELMLKRRIRHVPIVDENEKFVGLLTKRDVLAASVSALADLNSKEREELEMSIPISEIMITDIVVAEEKTNLFKAANFMLEQKHGCLPIFRGSKLVGILTESDFVRFSMKLMEKLAQYENVY
jgi:CBS domain-containing protein